MPRVTLYHLTRPRRLPLIEEKGLRTRADLSGLLGPPSTFDVAAPGRYAHGKRVSGWWSLDHARTRSGELGGGLVSYTVDPAKTLAAPAEQRETADVDDYWAAARPLRDWLADGEPPADLEVHQNQPVRAKHVRLHAPLLTEDELGPYAPLVAATADEDRLSAKALMHLAIIAADGDFDSQAFAAACALAWRDEPDDDGLIRELRQLGPDNVVSAVLAELNATAPDAVPPLRAALEGTREWAEEHGIDTKDALFARTAELLGLLADD